MRTFRPLAGLLLTGSLALAGGLPAWAAGPPSSTPLPWHSPNVITSGAPFAVSSIAPCPPLPNPADTLLVGVFVSFTGGGMGNVMPAQPGQPWSGQLTFNFSGTPRQASISADCEDFNGVFATPYATYQTHHVQLFSS